MSQIQQSRDVFKEIYSSQLDWHKKYPYLGVWEITKLEFNSGSNQITLSDQKIQFELEPNYPYIDDFSFRNSKKTPDKRVEANKTPKLTATSSDEEDDDEYEIENNLDDDDDYDHFEEDENNDLNEFYDSSDSDSSKNFQYARKEHKASSKSCFLSGDVIWHHLPSNENLIPFFDCHLFEYSVTNKTLKISGPRTLFDFKVSFTVDKNGSRDFSKMLLKNKEIPNLTCKRITNDEMFDKEYNYINMHNNEFLADVKVKALNGKHFYAHKSIIWLTLKDKTDSFINKLKTDKLDADFIEILLYYCYCDCLPFTSDQVSSASSGFGLSNKTFLFQNSLSDETKVKYFIDFISSFQELSNLKSLLDLYLNNSNYKLQTQKLISEIKQSFEMINTNFKYEETNFIQQRDNIFMNPPKLCYAIKNSFEQFYIALIKIIRILDMYSNKQGQLSKDERYEFIKNIKNCLPFCLEQLRKFLNSIHKQMIQLNDDKKREIAEYMILDIDNFVEFVLELIKNCEITIEKIVQIKTKKDEEAYNLSSNDEEDESDIDQEEEQTSPVKSSGASTKKSKNSKINKLSMKLTNSFKNAIHLRELKKMQKFSEKFKKNFDQVKESLQKYQKTKQDAKVNFVYKEFSNFIDNFIQEDIPRFLTKLDSISGNKKFKINKMIKSNDFKFGFKLLSAKTQWVLNQIRNSKAIVNPLINDVCVKLQNQEFNNELDKLDIGAISAIINDESSAVNKNKFSNISSNSNLKLDSFFKSKSANKNHLAQEANSLYDSKELSDILLEIHDDETKEIKLIKVHGCLIASRCMWFQRALSSGMQEAINRKVILHDTNLNLFEKFIKYLYSGSLKDTSSFSIDEIIELLTIADKYECDSLKNLLEIKIINLIRNHEDIQKSDLNSILIDYLNFSEQFGLNLLMETCISLLLKNITSYSKLIESDEFKNLPENIQAKIKCSVDKINERAGLKLKNKKKTWNSYKKRTQRLSDDDEDAGFRGTLNRRADISRDFRNNLTQYQHNINNLTLESNRLYELINYAHPLIVLDAQELDDSFSRLKEIIGTNQTTMSDEELVKLLIRNDCDLNRVIPIVLNFE